jgi:hypothetical protein
VVLGGPGAAYVYLDVPKTKPEPSVPAPLPAQQAAAERHDVGFTQLRDQHGGRRTAPCRPRLRLSSCSGSKIRHGDVHLMTKGHTPGKNTLQDQWLPSLPPDRSI